MTKYFLTEQTQQDLIQIRQFTLDHWGHRQSVVYLNDLKKTLELLSGMPSLGKNCCEDLGKDIYRFPFGSHMIYSLLTPDVRLIIVAVFHQSMVPENHLGKRLS